MIHCYHRIRVQMAEHFLSLKKKADEMAADTQQSPPPISPVLDETWIPYERSPDAHTRIGRNLRRDLNLPQIGIACCIIT